MKKNNFKIDFRFILILLVVIIGAQLVLTFYSKNAFHSFLINTQEWYQNFSVKRIANLTSTSLELIVESQITQKQLDTAQKNKVIKNFDIILSQHIMEKNADEICIFVFYKNDFIPVDDGQTLLSILTDEVPANININRYAKANELFATIKYDLINSEKLQVIVKNENEFYIFVPFAPNGELIGALYMKVIPDFNPITNEFITSYNDVALIYVLLVSSILILIYIVFSYTLKEKEKAQQTANNEHEKLVEERVDREKENTFTKRIYHAYHKAEKVIGFINMDLELLKSENVNEIKNRVGKYSNFIGRVIYDMKYYDPPINTIINPIFKTDINEVCRFIVDNLFLRIYKSSRMFNFIYDFDDRIPIINVNEYIIWEVVEPILQNSITHNSEQIITIKITTKYDELNKKISLLISDDGKGISLELLKINSQGIQKIFLENVSTKNFTSGQNGFGCYIAHTLAVKYCGWKMSVKNLSPKGCMFVIEISTN
ncbi:MAG: ATP-binding protein [Melioribacteraceae bacterium]|nr:ATP-binding protein [Melioribacteraceae bacterium]